MGHADLVCRTADDGEPAEKLGFTTRFGNLIGDSLSSTMHGTSWVIVLLLLNAAYFYTHYFLPAVMHRLPRCTPFSSASDCI